MPDAAPLTLDEIMKRFLAYVPTRPDGGSKDELMNLALALGMEPAQVEEALTAFLTTGVEMAAFDEPTYSNFADRYVELGPERGAEMASAVAERAARKRLQGYDLTLKIAGVDAALAAVPAAVARVNAALNELQNAGLSDATLLLVEQWAGWARRLEEGVARMLMVERTDLIQKRNRLS